MTTVHVRRVAVLGAGTMGAAIAAHAANAGLQVDLLDIAPDDPGDGSGRGEGARDGARDAIVRAGFERMRKARPPALMSERVAGAIRLGNFSDDFDRIAGADWIVEAIVERLEPKRALLARVEKTAKPDAIVTTNTSGIPLASIAEGRSTELRRRFFGTHFFNPPRWLKLLELVPNDDTDPALLAAFRSFGERVLGKGVVIAKDTPNFIGNRIGVFSFSQAVRYALANGYTIEEIDALTGPLIGRPKTATFRLADQVGLDIMLDVTDTVRRLAPDDESVGELEAPEPLERMRAAGLLGLKSGGGFYRRGSRDGRTVFDVLDLETLDYRPATEPNLPIVERARDRGGLPARLRFLVEQADDDRGARFVRDTMLASLAYTARRIPEIADSLAEVDHAVEWGFGYRLGPFRTWDALGVGPTVELMQRLGIEVAGWVHELLAAGHGSFYSTESGRALVWDPQARAYTPLRDDPEVLDLGRLRASGATREAGDSASLVDLGDGVLCLELHAPASAIDAGVVAMARRAAEELEAGEWAGLVIASQAANFCVGANLGQVGMAAYAGEVEQLEVEVKGLQDALMQLRFASKPVVAAPHGQTLGGGAEIVLAADRVVAAAETYIGLVEVGVGLIPAGGGCKELLRRIVAPAMAASGAPALPFVQRVFETIGLAKVSTSALEARDLGFLTADDRVVMNPDHVLAIAKQVVLDEVPTYRPPERGATIYAAGLPVLAALEMGLRSLQWAAQASEHDVVVAGRLARVLCGGELSAAQWVGEQRILDLEREAFLELVTQPKTLERIQAILTTGKPLRN